MKLLSNKKVTGVRKIVQALLYNENKNVKECVL